MVNCRQRMLYGRTTANRPSRFLEEIPEQNMHWESKPQPRYGGMEGDSTFGGDRWEGGPAYGGFGGAVSRSSYAPKPAPKPQSAASARKVTVGGSPLLQLQQGDMVEHTAFGKGMVMSLRPMGGDALLEVAFDKVGTKKLMLKAAGAHMKKL